MGMPYIIICYFRLLYFHVSNCASFLLKSDILCSSTNLGPILFVVKIPTSADIIQMKFSNWLYQIKNIEVSIQIALKRIYKYFE